MKRVLKISLFLLAGFLPVSSRAGEIESLQAELALLEQRRDSTYRRRDSLERQVRFQAEEVAGLKRRLADGDFSPVDQYRLESRMRASQVLTDSLDALSLTISALEGRIAGLRRTGDSLCRAVIDSLSLLPGKSRSAVQVRDILQKIGEYRILRTVFTPKEDAAAAGTYAHQAQEVAGRAAALAVEPGDSPEDIREKADFLSDMADKWQQRLALIVERIGRLEDERSIRQRIGEFAQEISLFDAGSASSRARVTSSGPETREQDQPPPGRQVFGPEPETPLSQESVSEVTGRDLELYDLEKTPISSEGIESLSSGDLEELLRIFQSREDSLRDDLDSLRAWGRRLRLKAEEIERQRKDSPRE